MTQNIASNRMHILRRQIMRALQLPKSITIRFHFDRENPKSSPSRGNFAEDLSVIENNGLEIISAVVLLEERMIEAVSKILFEENENSKLFFVEEVMGASDFSFAFKRRVFTRLLEKRQLLNKEEIIKLKAGLNHLMEWRNAFAHGQIIHEHEAGFVLQYFSGERKEVVLNDAFFEKVEGTIRSCLYLCNGIIQSA